MFTAQMVTFTVVVYVYQWMHSESHESKELLLMFLEDIAEGMDFVNHPTAAALDTAPVLWFTFTTEKDAVHFRSELEDLYNGGGWLIND
jgi:hypothetical protein